jgi:hypothetical protein
MENMHVEKPENLETSENHQTVAKFFNARNKVLRNIRDVIVSLFVDLARIVFFWVPGGDVAAGRALMTAHPFFIGLVIALFFILPSKHPLRLIIAGLSVVVVASQWLLGGCVVTRAEQRLTGSKETIMDPFLTLAGLPSDRSTRIAATIGMGTAFCTTLVWATACDWFF